MKSENQCNSAKLPKLVIFKFHVDWEILGEIRNRN